jgi:DNA-binding CsgD family transcriptional regulator
MFKQSRRKTASTGISENESHGKEQLEEILGAFSGEAAPAPAGLVLLNGRGELLYGNSIAQAVLCYPDTPKRAEQNGELGEKIRSELLRVLRYYPQPAELVSGRRKYLCRTLLLEPASTNGSGPTTAIVLERHSRRNDRLRRLCGQFRLTGREREAVLLLVEGLTTKEIAQRMGISPHTVKVFLRLIMMKVGATTRSGIVGKVNDPQL